MPLFMSAFGLSLAFFATPGAVSAQLLRNLGQRSFLWALLFQCGALIGLLLWALIACLGAAFLVQNIFAHVILGGTGAFLLLWLAWQALRDAYQGKMSETKQAQTRSEFAMGFALALANPFPIVFWLSILPTLVTMGQSSLNINMTVIFLAGFVVSALLYSLFMAGLIAWGQRFVSPLFFRVVNLVCGLALVFFALKLLWSTALLVKG